MWEAISDLNVHVQVAKASIFFRRFTLLKILPKIGTGLILLTPHCMLIRNSDVHSGNTHFNNMIMVCPKYIRESEGIGELS